jgi:2-haloacid dehalogenase
VIAGRPTTAVVFDLGGVLIDWNPRYLYRQLFADEWAMEAFLRDICPQSWNERQDAGNPISEATAQRIKAFPQHEDMIRAYYGRWEEMLGGPIAATVTLLRELHASNIPLYALTNWSAELFPIARRRFDFLKLFGGIMVSGEEGLIKPDLAIFHRLMDRFHLDPADTLFVDDNPTNVAAALQVGMRAHLFVTPSGLADDLVATGLLANVRMPVQLKPKVRNTAP